MIKKNILLVVLSTASVTFSSHVHSQEHNLYHENSESGQIFEDDGFLKVRSSPTSGWKKVAFDYEIQQPYDKQQSERYSFKDGVHDLWVFSNDKPHSPSSHTDPRTEIRIKNDYTHGWHQFEADFYVPSGTSGVNLMQIFGGGGSAATSFMLRIYDGELRRYSGQTLRKNAYNKWWHLNVIHNADSHHIEAYLDNQLVWQGEDHGSDNHYFKCGVYSQKGMSHKMESLWKNINIYVK
ncbi:UNKNOWN [Stylonychia lemnae]|uniref:Alginate lyase 2 domain-containing protein n=1 Tax=Stylonychia lemnae TaxID=5949 RepID=A0A078B4R3_STYLE|nr:UNKNOWN [Stylonychia lemnae]|eukprot:CDW89414.1 UNKNOWN [Stylonychia lemnae]